MTNAIIKTGFSFPKQKSFYKGKVRDVYNIDDKYLVMLVSDRISAFDVVLPEGIPNKGQVLNQIASKFLNATVNICPNWKIATPDPRLPSDIFANLLPLKWSSGVILQAVRGELIKRVQEKFAAYLFLAV